MEWHIMEDRCLRVIRVVPGATVCVPHTGSDGLAFSWLMDENNAGRKRHESFGRM